MPLLTINLTDIQLKAIFDAVQAWEHEPITRRAMSEMVRAVITKDADVNKAERAMIEAEAEARSRKYMSMSIQIRVMEVLANPKEHTVDVDKS